jgi:hypothetical protein
MPVVELAATLTGQGRVTIDPHPSKLTLSVSPEKGLYVWAVMQVTIDQSQPDQVLQHGFQATIEQASAVGSKALQAWLQKEGR